jgi:2-methylaconitate cis-trans-isomerase PrpF
MFPTGNVVDTLDVPGVGSFQATMINAGIPTIFLNAAELGYTGSELQEAINGDAAALARFETIRAHGAIRMGLIKDMAEAATRQHTPKIAFVAPPAGYTASSGKHCRQDIDLRVRAMSMGKLHHAMMGTAAVAIGTAAAIPGTLVNLAAGGGERQSVRFGHPSGTLRVGAEAKLVDGQWQVSKAIMSRSARVLMEGWVRLATVSEPAAANNNGHLRVAIFIPIPQPDHPPPPPGCALPAWPCTAPCPPASPRPPCPASRKLRPHPGSS